MARAMLVGAGGMGRAWAKNLLAHQAVTLAGWVDIREGAAEEAAQKLEVSGAYTDTDVSRALAAIRPDFVVDVTIPEAHHGVTLAVLGAGVPVIGEKPMAHSMTAAREMVSASEKANKLYMVSQSRRYDARLHAYRALIAERLGGLGILNSDFYIGAHFGGLEHNDFRNRMEHVLILDMAIHSFDQARFLLGDTNAVSVFCDEFNPPWSWYKGGGASATCLFEMTGGVRYTYRGSWCGEGRGTSWECEWRAVGENGSATWNGTATPAVAEIVTERGDFLSKTEAIEAAVEADAAGGIAGSLRDFLKALETPGYTPMGECHDNIKSLAMVFAAIESAQTGQRVMVEA
ncbi:MAG: Gfo/Idh/MocA family oxidoreductase [Cytophagales bacterium]|nr:Gfo/Idh/MocA family oxidoreductase [Armatimonadota bacterium]